MTSWLLHLIGERKLSASSVNLAIHAPRAFYGRFLGQPIEPLLKNIKRPRRTVRQSGRIPYEQLSLRQTNFV